MNGLPDSTVVADAIRVGLLIAGGLVVSGMFGFWAFARASRKRAYGPGRGRK